MPNLIEIGLAILENLQTDGRRTKGDQKNSRAFRSEMLIRKILSSTHVSLKAYPRHPHIGQTSRS